MFCFNISRKLRFPLTRIIASLAGITLLFCSVELEAQDKWSLTIKPAVNVPAKEIQGTELATGYGIDGSLSYGITDFLALNAGWGWNKFSADNSFAGNDMDFEATGYTLGIQFNYPTTPSKITYSVGVGGIYNHIEIENSNGDIVADSGHDLGAQVEAGISIKAGNHFALVPFARYRALSNEFNMDQTTQAFKLQYFSAGLGLSWIF